MNPVPVTTLLFINSLVQQCNRKNFLQVHHVYWWVEEQQRTEAPLVEKQP
jgi:hypothetical protein